MTFGKTLVLAMASSLQPNSDGLQPKSDGL